LKVLFVTTEMDDFVRVGGLAAVCAALPRALRPWSDVRVMLPGYRDVVEQFVHIEIVGQCAPLADMPACSLGRASTKDGLPVYVLLCPQLYDRPGNPYGDETGRDWSDNDIRFGRFASAAAELAAGTLDKNWAADLVHANDWQAALVPAYLAWKGVKVPSILTIHNLAYQGLFPRESLRRIGAPEAPSTSTGSSSTTSSPSSKAASSTPRTSPPSARPMPGRSRRPNSAAGSKACCAAAPTLRNSPAS
jgi:starch synthase